MAGDTLPESGRRRKPRPRSRRDNGSREPWRGRTPRRARRHENSGAVIAPTSADRTRNASIRTGPSVTCRAASRSPSPAAPRRSKSTVLSSVAACCNRGRRRQSRSLCTKVTPRIELDHRRGPVRTAPEARGSAVTRKAETIGCRRRRRLPSPTTRDAVVSTRGHLRTDPAQRSTSSTTRWWKVTSRAAPGPSAWRCLYACTR